MARRIFGIRYDTNRQRYLVDDKNPPLSGLWEVAPGDDLIWEPVGTDVTVTFLLPLFDGNKQSEVIQAGGSGGLKLKQNLPLRGVLNIFLTATNKYKPAFLAGHIQPLTTTPGGNTIPYEVYCHKNDDFAEESSDPKIIIR